MCVAEPEPPNGLVAVIVIELPLVFIVIVPSVDQATLSGFPLTMCKNKTSQFHVVAFTCEIFLTFVLPTLTVPLFT